MEHVKLNEKFRFNLLKEINLVRTNPTKYANKLKNYLPYFKGKVFKLPESFPIVTNEGSFAFEDAINFLINMNPINPLKLNSNLSNSAYDCLVDIQKIDDLDKMSKMNLDTYLENHGRIVGDFSQMVDFGSSFAELVVINLFVDDGNLNRINRINLVNDKLNFIGIATGLHPHFNNCTVLMFARHFLNKDENQELIDLSRENYEHYEENRNEETSENNIIDFNDDEFITNKQEKIIIENGITKKIITIEKHIQDGKIEIEIFKELVN